MFFRLLLLLLLQISFDNLRASILPPCDLRTNGYANPIGIDALEYNLSWKIPVEYSSNNIRKKGQYQTAYQIQVAKEVGAFDSGINILWDSGKTISDKQNWIPIVIDSLSSMTKYYWRVRYWNESNNISSWSSPVWFETGIIYDKDWGNAVWISGNINSVSDSLSEFWKESSILDIDFQHKEKKNGSGGVVPRYVPKQPIHYTESDLNLWYNKIKSMLDRIKPATYFRRTFTLPEKPVKARLYITGLGYYKPYLNGKNIPSPHLAPNVSHYNKRVLYNVYDVTDFVKQGNNCVGAIVAVGRWNEFPSPFMEKYYGDNPFLYAKLEIDLCNGKKVTVCTDESWEAGIGAYRKNAFWVGEAYDANSEPEGWSLANFNTRWEKVKIVTSPTEKLQWDYDLPQKTLKEIHAKKRIEVSPGVWVYDFGEMIIGKPRIDFNLPKNEMVSIRYSETVNQDFVDLDNGLVSMFFKYYDSDVKFTHPYFLRPKARGGAMISTFFGQEGKEKEQFFILGFTDAFKSSGKKKTWMPSFDYVGFRYLEIANVSNPPELDDVVAIQIHSDLENAGLLEINDTLLSQINDACHSSVLMNIHSQPEDNPGGERAGGMAMTADINFIHMAARSNFELVSRKNIDDTRIINEDFDYPATVTFSYRHKNKSGFPDVADGYVYGPQLLKHYSYYGDKGIMMDFIPTMERYYSKIFDKGYDWYSSIGFGDHIDFSSSWHIDGSALDRAYCNGTQILIQLNGFISVLELLDKDSLLVKYTNYRDKLVDEINKRYYDSKTKRYCINTFRFQGAQLFALDAGLYPQEVIQNVVDEIAKDVIKNGQLTTGSRNSERLLHYLTKYNHGELALKLMRKTDYPSIGNMLKSTGGSSVWEAWGFPNSKTGDANYAQAEGIAAMANWFYRDIVGLEPMVEYPAFERFRINPNIDSSIAPLYYEYNSPRGKIVTKWIENNKKIEWSIIVPPNSVAEIYVPGELKKIPIGLKFIGKKNGRNVYEAVSGEYLLDFIKE